MKVALIMHKKLVIFFYILVFQTINGSEIPQRPPLLPLRAKARIIYFLNDSDSCITATNYKSLALVNKEWRITSAVPRIFQQMIIRCAEIEPGADEISFAREMRKMPGYQNLIIRGWLQDLQEQKAQEKHLFNAAEKNDSELIEHLVKEQRININARNRFGETPLFRAAYLNNLAAVHTLLDLGASVDLPDKHGCAPLKRAAAGGYVDVIRLLLRAGSKPNNNADEGYTALIMGAKRGDYKVCEALIDAGAKVNMQANDGESALLVAVKDERPNIQLIKLLLKSGANAKLKNKWGNDALSIAQNLPQSFGAQLIKILESPDA